MLTSIQDTLLTCKLHNYYSWREPAEKGRQQQRKVPPEGISFPCYAQHDSVIIMKVSSLGLFIYPLLILIFSTATLI